MVLDLFRGNSKILVFKKGIHENLIFYLFPSPKKGQNLTDSGWKTMFCRKIVKKCQNLIAFRVKFYEFDIFLLNMPYFDRNWLLLNLFFDIFLNFLKFPLSNAGFFMKMQEITFGFSFEDSFTA